MKRCVVTGGAGFLGRELVRQLCAGGHEVRATDRQRDSGSARCEFVTADILDIDALRPALRGADCVVHTAGLAHVRANPERLRLINEVGTRRVLQASAGCGVERVVLASSVAVYGTRRTGPTTEADTCAPVTPYGQSKLGSEQEARTIADAAGIALTVLRFATMYGEEDPGSVGRLMRALDRKRFVWFGDGSNRKTLLHRDDAVRACILAAEAPSGVSGTYNVTSDVVRVRDVVQELCLALGRSVPRHGLPPSVARWILRLVKGRLTNSARIGNVACTLQRWMEDEVHDGGLFRSCFAFVPRITLTAGLRRQATWYLKQQGRHVDVVSASSPLFPKR